MYKSDDTRFSITIDVYNQLKSQKEKVGPIYYDIFWQLILAIKWFAKDTEVF
jgi:hypothetical protein